MKIIILLICSLIGNKAILAKSTAIEIQDSYVTRDSNDLPISYVKLLIKEPAETGGLISKLEVILSSNCKNTSFPGVIYQNSEKTIVGFTASNVRVNYKINLAYLVGNKVMISQDFSLDLSDILKKIVPNIDVDLTEIFLANITERKLSIGYRTDSGKNCFHFQVELKSNGSLEFVPGSLKLNELPAMGHGVDIKNKKLN